MVPFAPVLYSSSHFATRALCDARKMSTGVRHCSRARVALASSSSAERAVCPTCRGAGWKPCGQCLGTGVNQTDVFFGRYKAGDACWLCDGKARTMCGNCVDLTDSF